MLGRMISYIVNRNPWIADTVKRILGNKLVGNSRWYRQAVLKKAAAFHRDFRDEDTRVHIETTLNCNARCVMCYHGYAPLTGVMTMPLFEKIVRECKEAGIRTIWLSVYGEPLLDPHFFDRVRLLRAAGLEYSFFTNGSLLTGEKARMLLELGGLRQIHFSVNGFSKENYELVMRGPDRDATYANILGFLALKKERAADDIVVGVSCVKTKYNRGELREFVRFWKQQGGVEQVITADLWDRFGQYAAEKEIGEIGPLHKKDLWLTPCRELWGGIFVYHDGRVAPCCADNDLRELIIGDAVRQPLKEIIAGEALRRLRETHLADRRHEHPVCGRCSYHSIWFL